MSLITSNCQHLIPLFMQNGGGTIYNWLKSFPDLEAALLLLIGAEFVRTQSLRQDTSTSVCLLTKVEQWFHLQSSIWPYLLNFWRFVPASFKWFAWLYIWLRGCTPLSFSPKSPSISIASFIPFRSKLEILHRRFEFCTKKLP